ncbi:MAG: hypothetical protein ACRD0P_02060 [Stackebrandtia sp.]
MQVQQTVNGPTVTAVAPGGDVRARSAPPRAPEVEVRVEALSGYDDRGLAAEVGAAVTGVLRGRRRAEDRERDEYLREFPEDTDRVTERERRIAAVVAAVEVRQVSDGGRVKVAWNGDTDVQVRLQPGTLAESADDPAALVAEINDALAQAAAASASQSLEPRLDIVLAHLRIPQGRS